MSIREQVKNEILGRARLADEQTELIKTTEGLSEEQVISAVHSYVCLKFFLDPSEGRDMTLYELAELSLDRSLEMDLPKVKESERATTCGMAGSAPMKIALLLNALKKALDLKVEPRRLGNISNTKELGILVYEEICRRRNGPTC